MAEVVVSPAFDGAVRSQSTSVVPAYSDRPEDTRRRQVIDAAGTPASNVAAVPQRARKTLAAVYGLELAVRRWTGASTPQSVNFGFLLVDPAYGGAIRMLRAGIDFPIDSAHYIPPAPDFPIRPESAGMVNPGVYDLERAVRRCRLAEDIAIEPLVAAPTNYGWSVRIPQA